MYVCTYLHLYICMCMYVHVYVAAIDYKKLD